MLIGAKNRGKVNLRKDFSLVYGVHMKKNLNIISREWPCIRNKLLQTYFSILFINGLGLTVIIGTKLTWLTIMFLRCLIHR